MVALVTIRRLGIASASQLEIEYSVLGSWGREFADVATAADQGALSLNQLVTAIKRKVIAWAATAPGGSVTLTAREIVIVGMGDEVSGVRKSADEAITSGTFVNVADLAFELSPASSYKFKFTGGYTTAAGTTGLQLAVNGPASPAFVRYVGQIHTTATAVLGGAGAAYDAAIAATASGGATALPFAIEGSITTGAAGGPFSLRARSEVGGSAVTILRGSIGELVAVG